MKNYSFAGLLNELLSEHIVTPYFIKTFEHKVSNKYDKLSTILLALHVR
jgi:hypothetical protein